MMTAPAPDVLADCPDLVEDLRIALLDGAAGDLRSAATTLLTDIPGAVYAQPQLRRYITRRRLLDRHVAEVDWPELGADLLAGQLDLPQGHRALLMIAASIGGGPAVRLGALLLDLNKHDDKHELGLVMGALQDAGGVW